MEMKEISPGRRTRTPNNPLGSNNEFQQLNLRSYSHLKIEKYIEMY